MIDYDLITGNDYNFIEIFYRNIRLNLTVYFDYFHMPSTETSIQLYNSIKDYYIVFIQFRCAWGQTLNIDNLLIKYLHDEKVILVCNDKNLYDKEKDEKKYTICENFVYNKIVHYTDTIQNSDEIYIIDSCFIGIVLPYLKTNRLKANTVKIIPRNIAGSVML